MRAIRTWGSVRGVPGNWHPYRDLCGDATRAPIPGPDQAEDRVPILSPSSIKCLLALAWDGIKR